MFITSTFSVIRSRSLWHFHAPVILPYVLKTISWINVILGIGSVWHHNWHPNKCRSPWPVFHCSVLLPFILNVNWCMNIIIWDYESVWSDIDLKINVGHLTYISWSSDFMLHLEDSLVYYYHSLGLCDLYFKALWVSFVSPTIRGLSVIFAYNDTVWPKPWPQSKYKSAWPLFHGLVILFNIF